MTFLLVFAETEKSNDLESSQKRQPSKLRSFGVVREFPSIPDAELWPGHVSSAVLVDQFPRRGQF